MNYNWAKGRLCLLRMVLIALVLVILYASQARAYDVVDAGENPIPEPIKTITTQASEFIPGDSFSLKRSGSPAFAVGDTIEISLSGGATFADSAYSLEESSGGAGTGRLDFTVLQTASPAGKSSIRFLMQNSVVGGGALVAGAETLILSGAAIAAQRINVNLPRVDGRDIYVTFTVRDSGGNSKGSIQHLTFDNTLAPALTEAQAQSAIQNVLATHARNMTSQSVGLSGLLTGKGFGNSNVTGVLGKFAPAGNALAAAAGVSQVSLPISLQVLEGQGHFATSLNQIRDWSSQLGEKPSERRPQTNDPFNVWVKGRWQGIVDTRGGTRGEGDFGLLMAGADYRYKKDTLIGILAQFDVYDNTATGQNSKGEGEGWMVGPYLVTRLADNLIWDVRAAWGQSKNKINALDQGWDDYDGERWQVETNLTGEMEYKGWEILPQLGMNYFQEEQKAYTSFKGYFYGTRFGPQTVALGNLSFGPEVSRSFDKFETLTLRPFAGLKGIWDFKSPDIIHTDGSSINTQKLRARAALGGEVIFNNGGSIYATYIFDGIGLSGYEAQSIELVASTPVHFGFLPKGSQLKSSLNQSVSGLNSNQAMLNLDVPFN